MESVVKGRAGICSACTPTATPMKVSGRFHRGDAPIRAAADACLHTCSFSRSSVQAGSKHTQSPLPAALPACVPLRPSDRTSSLAASALPPANPPLADLPPLAASGSSATAAVPSDESAHRLPSTLRRCAIAATHQVEVLQLSMLLSCPTENTSSLERDERQIRAFHGCLCIISTL